MAKDTKLNAVVTLSDRMSKPLSGLNKRLRGMSAPIQKFSSQLKQLDRNSGFKQLRSGIGNVTKQVAILGGAAAGVMGALGMITNRVAQNGDQIAKTARTIGISGESLQEWTYIAERYGVEQSGLNTSLQQFTKRLGEAKAGTGSMVTLLDKMNPALLEQLTATESVDEALELYIEAMRNIEDPTQQAALATAAFGRSGLAMTNIARGSKDELAALRAELHALGGVIGEEALANAEAYQDSMTKMNRIMSGLQNIIGAQLMPHMIEMMERFGAWYIQNKELIQLRIGEYIQKVKSAFHEMGKWFQANGPKILDFIKSIGGFKTVAIGIAAVIAGPLLAAIAGLIIPLTMVATTITTLVAPAIAALGKALLANPIGIAIAAIAGAAFLIYKNWEPITEFFSDLWGGIQQIFDDGMAKIQPIIDKLGKAAEAVTKPVKKLFEFGGNAVDAVGDVAGSAVSGAKNMWNSFTGNQNINSNNQNVNVGGKLEISVSQDSPPRVKSVQSDNRNMDILVGAGMYGAGL